MKIAYLSSSLMPSIAANSLHVMKMCAAFARQGHEVTLYTECLPHDRAAPSSQIFSHYGLEENFSLRRMPRFGLPGWAALTALRSARHASQTADLIYARNLLAAYLAAGLHSQVILEVHRPLRFGSAGERAFLQLLGTTRLRRVIVVTRSLEAHYLHHYPELEGRITVAPDAADPFPGDLAPVELLQEPGLLKVGYVGHLYPGKGMEVVAELLPRCPWAHFHVVGGHPADVANWKARTEGSCNITFYGHQPHGVASSFTKAFDVVMLPNQRSVGTHENKRGGKGVPVDIAKWTSPLKMFEYMAAGVPMIASDLPVLREVLRDRDNALLCPPDDPASWALALQLVRDDGALGKEIGARAQSDFVRNYTWDRRVSAVLSA